MAPSVDLAAVDWTLTGWRPQGWRLRHDAPGGFLAPDHGPFPAVLPGSVQENLRHAGAIPDWHRGLDSLAIEWVEHRHWMFSTRVELPALPPGMRRMFAAESLDCSGWLLVDDRIVAEFRGPHLPTEIDLTAALAAPGPHALALVFATPPEEEAQFGFTSRARHFKPRYSFGWDWCVRVVPLGARGALRLETHPAVAVRLVSAGTRVTEDLGRGELEVRLDHPPLPGAEAVVSLARGGRPCVTATFALDAAPRPLRVAVPAPELWWPAGAGPQPLYELDVVVRAGGDDLARFARSVGFRHLAWRPCAGAPPGALPWLCMVNGRPVFLQGVNWTPVRICYQDTEPAALVRLVELYRTLGCNVLRVWGGAVAEAPEFYAACDRAGLLVWQEFPLTSSAADGEPPADPDFLSALGLIGRHLVRSLRHHPCLLQWGGGNELHRLEPTPGGPRRVPLAADHPITATLAAIVGAEDPERRFVPTSPTGPAFEADPANFGRGLHHNVHGPWGFNGFADEAAWNDYWRRDDALFRTEVGLPGASSTALIQRHAGTASVWPPTSPLWRHSAGWWTQWPRVAAAVDTSDPAEALARYVALTQATQARALATAAAAAKSRFPHCGGFIVWMGHDCFPCPANTAIIDFEHQPKPAALALASVFLASPPDPASQPPAAGSATARAAPAAPPPAGS